MMVRRRTESGDTSQPLRKQDMLRAGRNKDRRGGRKRKEGKDVQQGTWWVGGAATF